MDNAVMAALAKIKYIGGIDILKKCSSVEERYQKLAELLPETLSWSPMTARQLAFHIHYAFGVDLGVCQHYLIDSERQYCRFGGEKQECLCVIPQPFCRLRDRNKKPKYPELMSERSK